MPLERDLVAGEAWSFDQAVADDFDDMLSRSIPDYDEMRAYVTSACVRILERSVADGAADVGYRPFVVDVGCSRGGALAPILDAYADVDALGCDVSAPMLEAAAFRFRDDKRVMITPHDLRDGFPEVAYEADVVLCVLTLQFTPIEYRKKILRSFATNTRRGGALLLVEKVLGSDEVVDDLLVDLYYDEKRANGYSNDEILRKRASLEGVLVPVDAATNEAWLRLSGYRSVDCIWRKGVFAAFLAIRSEF